MEFENKKSEIITEPGSITPIIEEVSETIPKDGDSRIRHIELANGKKTWHIEQFSAEGEWLQIDQCTHPVRAMEVVDRLRGNKVIKNEILDY